MNCAQTDYDRSQVAAPCYCQRAAARDVPRSGISGERQFSG
jgi:hypothetical protein